MFLSSLLCLYLTCNRLQISPLYTMLRVDTGSCGHTTRHIFKKKDKIGTGASCDVFKGVEKSSGTIHALKIFKDLEWSNSHENAREVEALTRLSHPNIVGYHGHEEEYVSGHRVLVMEYCQGGSLHAFLQEPENSYGLGDQEFSTFLNDTCQGLKYLRANGYVHRDIKPGNILRQVKQDGSVTYKLADFGASKRVEHNHGQFMSLAGTEEYLHPAMYEKAFIDRSGAMVFNESTDMWSLGVTIYHACTGDIPFKPFGGMITCKPPGTIAGHQLTPTEDIRWRQSLPETCQLSFVSRQISTVCPDLLLSDQQLSIIAGLIEADQGRQWTFQTFENEVKNLIKMKMVSLIDTNNGTQVSLYLPSDPRLSQIQEAVAMATEVPASRQILLYTDRPLEESMSNQGHVTCVTRDLQEPIILVSKDEPEEEGRFYRSLDRYPDFGNRPSLDEDIKSATKVCVYVNCVRQGVMESLMVSRGQHRAESALWSFLKVLLLRMDKKFKLLTELSKEKQLRLEMMKEFEESRKYISHEVNSSIGHTWKTARSCLKQIQQALWKFKSDVTKLKTDIYDCETSFATMPHYCTTDRDESLKTLESYFVECKSVWKQMRKQRQDSPLSECEVLMQKKQRRDIREICSDSQSLWRRCLQEKNTSKVHFLESKSKYLSYVNQLEEMEQHLQETNRYLVKLSDVLVEMWAYTGRAWRDVKRSISRLYVQKDVNPDRQLLNTSASSGYSSLDLKTELNNTRTRFAVLLDELPEVELFRLEDI